MKLDYQATLTYSEADDACRFDSIDALYDAVTPLKDELRRQLGNPKLFFTLCPVSYGEGCWIARIDFLFTDAEGFQRPKQLFGFVESLAKGGA